ncbi:MAG: helix-turn-helix transcriptional regulator [Clostridia bacterium]|nr:helix-turn-helix transcriptional regulator [Clostridia bacterium]MBR3487518.1 helix-turn-helix transcriptional regulator [Clostridia bacterium]
MVDFAKRLRNELETRGVSQRWLADAADTKEATISRYVNGINKSPDVEILVGIAKALNVTTDYLLGLTDIPRVKYEINAEERILLSTLRKASERDLAIIWQILDAYLTPSERGFLRPTEDEDEVKAG